MNYWAHMNSYTWFILSVGHGLTCSYDILPGSAYWFYMLLQCSTYGWCVYEAQIIKFLLLPRRTTNVIYHLISLPSCSRMLAYGLCSTALPPETLMGWYQRLEQSSLLWGFFTTTAYTPTLRYPHRSLSFFIIGVASSQCVLSLPYTGQYSMCQTPQFRLCLLLCFIETREIQYL